MQLHCIFLRIHLSQLSFVTMSNYAILNTKNLSSLDKLIGTLMPKAAKKPKISPKQLLTILREIVVHCSSSLMYDSTFFLYLFDQYKESPDQDTDKKIARTSLFLLFELISSASISESKRDSEDFYFKVLTLANLLTADASSKTGGKQFLALRMAGMMVSTCDQLEQDKIAGDTICKQLQNILNRLTYPIKQSKFAGFGNDKEYFSKILLWCGTMSGLRRSNHGLPRECYPNLFVGIRAKYAPLVWHALGVLYNTVVDVTNGGNRNAGGGPSEPEGDKKMSAAHSADTAQQSTVMDNRTRMYSMELQKMQNGDSVEELLEMMSMMLDRLQKAKTDRDQLLLSDALVCAYFMRCVGSFISPVNIVNLANQRMLMELITEAISNFVPLSV